MSNVVYTDVKITQYQAWANGSCFDTEPLPRETAVAAMAAVLNVVGDENIAREIGMMLFAPPNARRSCRACKVLFGAPRGSRQYYCQKCSQE